MLYVWIYYILNIQSCVLCVCSQIKAEETQTQEQLQTLELELRELRKSFTVADQLTAEQLSAAKDELHSLHSTVQRISQERVEVKTCNWIYNCFIAFIYLKSQKFIVGCICPNHPRQYQTTLIYTIIIWTLI